MSSSRKLLRVLNLRGIPIHKQLCYEEILLRRSTDNWFLFNTHVPSVAIVLGFSAKVPELVNLELAANDRIPLIRRYTGGGTVVVDNSTVFTTFIMNEADVPSKPYPREIMIWSETDVFGPVFRSNHCHSSAVRDENHQFSLRENDYVLGPRKMGGNAQSIIKNRWVHHTSFLWDFDVAKMRYLKIPAKRPAYRADRNHEDFLTRLKDHWSSVDLFESTILQQLQEKFDVLVETEMSMESTIASLATLEEHPTIIRTKLESAETHLNASKIIPSLVKIGPSCVNL